MEQCCGCAAIVVDAINCVSPVKFLHSKRRGNIITIDIYLVVCRIMDLSVALAPLCVLELYVI
jgi:hypothetical protein